MSQTPGTLRSKLSGDAAKIIARYPRPCSALLPLLHLVQSEEGYVSLAGITFCADLLHLTEAKVTGVVSYYTMYKRRPVGEYHVGVCTNTLCAIVGGDQILVGLLRHLGIGDGETTPDGKISVEHVECNAACDYAPVVMVNWEFFDDMTPQRTTDLADGLRAGAGIAPSLGAARLCTWKQAARILAGFPDDQAVGYRALRRALVMSPAEVIQTVKESGLRGRGGAGFPPGSKWAFIPQGDGKPHHLVIHAEESGPGTCKDLPLMLNSPHTLVEGAIIAAYAIQAQRAFIYARGEVLHAIRRLHRAVAEASQAGYLGEDILRSGFGLDIVVHAGAGAYECGKETALLESLEGYRGLPRNKPLQIFDETTCVVRATLRWSEFYQHESCGKCTPCREGTFWLVRVLDRLERGQGSDEDLDLVLDTCDNILGRAFCPLGDAATGPVLSSIGYVRDEYLEHRKHGGCPFDPAQSTLFGGG